MPRVSPGTYTARLTVDGEVMEQKVQVEIDPDHPDPVWLSNERANEQLELEEWLRETEEEAGGDDR